MTTTGTERTQEQMLRRACEDAVRQWERDGHVHIGAIKAALRVRQQEG